MKILLLTGSHPRHAAVARKLAETGALAGLVIEEREEHTPSPPPGLPPVTEALFRHHFKRRAEAESTFFDDPTLPHTRTLRVCREELNGAGVRQAISRVGPDLLLSYGVHMLDSKTLAAARGERWNIHGGLSPWYRGVITHFWPSYFLEPQMTGMTVHDLSGDIDHGQVVHQTAAPLIRGDGLHELACRAVMALIEELPALVNRLSETESLSKKSHKTTGRIWRASDWRAEHLHLIYDHYDDRIVDHALDGAFSGSAPKLHKQF